MKVCLALMCAISLAVPSISHAMNTYWLKKFAEQIPEDRSAGLAIDELIEKWENYHILYDALKPILNRSEKSLERAAAEEIAKLDELIEKETDKGVLEILEHVRETIIERWH